MTAEIGRTLDPWTVQQLETKRRLLMRWTLSVLVVALGAMGVLAVVFVEPLLPGETGRYIGSTFSVPVIAGLALFIVQDAETHRSAAEKSANHQNCALSGDRCGRRQFITAWIFSGVVFLWIFAVTLIEVLGHEFAGSEGMWMSVGFLVLSFVAGWSITARTLHYLEPFRTQDARA